MAHADHETVLLGVVGSTVYGLAREGSDVDRSGVFVADTLDVAGLGWSSRKETRSRTCPDVTLHEVGKFARLALGANPTVLEVLWLPEYDTRISPDGETLIGARRAFLSTKTVRDAYFGYATQQARRLAERGDGSFSADTRRRTAKHARHMLRLLRQATHLFETGEMRLPVDRPEDYWAFDDMSVEQMLRCFEREVGIAGEACARSALPAVADRDRVRAVVRGIRRRHVECA